MVSEERAEAILEKLRFMLKKRGAEGIRGLARNFKICDTDGSGKLDVGELAKCFALCKLGLRADETQELHAHFDKSGDGLVSFDEFVKSVRGKMNEPRRKLCLKCFRALDNAGDGSGFLTIEDIAPYYNAADHPDVKEEKKTEEEVLKEFLDGFEGGNGDRNGSVTIDEWISYYEDISSSIDEDDLFGTMLASTWSSLTTKNPEGETVPAIQYVSESDMNVLESILRKNIYQKSSGVSEDKTLKKAFKQFDTDGSGEVSFREFLLAMERFGLSVIKPGDRGGGGVPPEVMRGLFDRYNADQSEAISYSEFSAGLYGVASKDDSEDEADAYNPQGGQNPWLPTLVGKESMDDHYRRPYRQVQEKDPLGNVFNVERRVKGQRSIANRAPNQFELN